MNERNPYEAPRTPIADIGADPELAGLGERLGAALIDVVLMLKIKIVDLQGRKPSFGRLAGLRYLPMQLVNMIPFVGGLIALVNVLMIFRSDRRCGHDLIAGTRVVNAR